jgi:hypothetical protein
MARFFPFRPPRSANFSPQRLSHRLLTHEQIGAASAFKDRELKAGSFYERFMRV